MDKRFEGELMLLPSYCSWAMHVVPVLKPGMTCRRHNKLLAAAFCKKASQLGAVGEPQACDACPAALCRLAAGAHRASACPAPLSAPAPACLAACSGLCSYQHSSAAWDAARARAASDILSSLQHVPAARLWRAEVVATGPAARSGISSAFRGTSMPQLIVRFSSVPVCLIAHGVAQQQPGQAQSEGMMLLSSGASLDAAGAPPRHCCCALSSCAAAGAAAARRMDTSGAWQPWLSDILRWQGTS